jgi:signal peptidase II
MIVIFSYSVLFCVLVALDRLSKLWAIVHCAPSLQVNELLTFHVVYNRGISWSLLSFTDEVMFYALTMMVTVITIWLVQYAYKRALHEKLIIGELLIIAGSCSNIIDRFWYQGVVDFIVLSYNGYTWPLFNGSDICIVSGVVILMISLHKE